MLSRADLWDSGKVVTRQSVNIEYAGVTLPSNYGAAGGYYDIGCQSAQALAICFDIVPESLRKLLMGYLASSVNFRQRRTTSGYAGTKWVVEALAKAERNDVIWQRAINSSATVHLPCRGDGEVAEGGTPRRNSHSDTLTRSAYTVGGVQIIGPPQDDYTNSASEKIRCVWPAQSLIYTVQPEFPC